MKLDFFTKKVSGRFLGMVVLLCGGMLGSSCTDKTPPKLFAEFYAEAPRGAGIPLTMPLSQLQYGRVSDAFLTAADMTDVQEGKMPDGTYCVVFKFDDKGQRELYRQSVNYQGRHFFLIVNDKPMGVRAVDRPMEDGLLYFFVEIPETDKDHPQKALEQFVFDLQDSIKRIAEMKKK